MQELGRACSRRTRRSPRTRTRARGRRPAARGSSAAAARRRRGSALDAEAEVVEREGVRAPRRSAGRARATCAANAPTNGEEQDPERRVCHDVDASREPQSRSLGELCDAASTAFSGLDHRRHDLEQVADDAVVGDLEDRRVGILVDRDDGAASPSCRPGAESRRRCRARDTASARRSGPSCRPGAPSAASRRRRSAATRRARRRAPRPAAARAAMFACSLMPRPTDDDPLGLRQIDRLLALPGTAPRASGGSPTRRPSTVSARTGAGAAPLRRLVGAKRADLEGDEVRRRPLRHDVGGQLALEHRPRRTRSRRRPVLIAGDVGDERAVEPRRQLRREVARLIGVRQQHDATAPAARSRACSAAV